MIPNLKFGVVAILALLAIAGSVLKSSYTPKFLSLNRLQMSIRPCHHHGCRRDKSQMRSRLPSRLYALLGKSPRTSKGDTKTQNKDGPRQTSIPLDHSLTSFQNELQSLRKANATRKIMTTISSRQEGGYLSDEMMMMGFKTLQRMGRIDLSLEIIPHWLHNTNTIMGTNDSSRLTADIVNNTVNCAKLFIRESSKQGRMDLCESILLSGFGIKFTSSGPRLRVVVNQSHPNNPTTALQALPADDHLTVFNVFADLALGYYHMRRYDKGLAVLGFLSTLRMDYYGFRFFSDSDDTAMQLLKWSLKEASHEVIMDTIDRLLAVDCLDKYEASQILTSNYMKELTFVKGAVSMATLAIGDRSEVAFIGRSNVGKSSLINMVCNRKKLAFTSKTPGKTSEFNYFAASGLVGSPLFAQNISYYLVDLPGVGFAEASSTLRKSWLSLLNEYAHQRNTLRVLFHLVDSRHGFLDADEECLSLLETLPLHVEYVIVLTKVDKIGAKGVSPYVLDKVSKELKARTDRNITVLETSSEHNRGGAALWATLLRGISR